MTQDEIIRMAQEGMVFGYTTENASEKPLHHFALVLRDLDKTFDGWCEEPEFYLDGERLYAAPVKQAEQEPVAWLWVSEHGSERLEWEPVEDTSKWKSTPLYAAPVRTKDLTDDEIYTLYSEPCSDREMIEFARAVIAADREKNK